MVTPSANRNSVRVATPYYIYTQGRGASPLNPGLGKRNSYRVAAADGWPLPGHPQGAGVHRCPSPSLPKGRESIGAPPRPSPRGGSPYLLCLRVFGGAPSPWGRLGWGLYVGRRKPLPSLPFWGNRRGACRCSLPLGRVGEGLWERVGAGLLGFSLVSTYATIFIQELV